VETVIAEFIIKLIAAGVILAWIGIAILVIGTALRTK
jgi:hypothetical protein